MIQTKRRSAARRAQSRSWAHVGGIGGGVLWGGGGGDRTELHKELSGAGGGLGLGEPLLNGNCYRAGPWGRGENRGGDPALHDGTAVAVRGNVPRSPSVPPPRTHTAPQTRAKSTSSQPPCTGYDSN